jgi:GTPase SAR1 family protein
VIVFDLSRKETFENINVWISQLTVHSSLENPPILILGNKLDVEEGNL